MALYGTDRFPSGDPISDNFLVMIHSNVQRATVVGMLPEKIRMDIKSDWNTLLSGGAASRFGIILQETTGRTLRTKFSSAQVWEGSSPLEMTITLEFNAVENALINVLYPIIYLMKMALPRQGAGGTGKAGEFLKKAGELGHDIAKGVQDNLLIPPGPRLFNLEHVSSDRITVNIGSWLNFKDVIIVSVNPDFDTEYLSPEGFPMRASCDIVFRSLFSVTGNQLSDVFSV